MSISSFLTLHQAAQGHNINNTLITCKALPPLILGQEELRKKQFTLKCLDNPLFKVFESWEEGNADKRKVLQSLHVKKKNTAKLLHWESGHRGVERKKKIVRWSGLGRQLARLRITPFLSKDTCIS